MTRRAIALILAAGLGACTVGPDYRRPQLASPPAYQEARSTVRTQVEASTPDLTRWWGRFGDPLLDDLVRRGLADNPDLQAATSRVRQARAQVRIADAAELPSLQASGDAITFNSNRKSSLAAGAAAASAGAGAAAGAAGFSIPSHLNLYSAGFDATWELDLFGGARRGIEEAKAQAEAAEWSRRDGQVSLAAEIAADYFTLRATQARIAIGQAELQRQKDLFGLIAARRRSGFVTELDVNQQSTQVAVAAAQIPQLEAQAKAEIHALGILIGQPPEALSDELGPPPSVLPLPPSSLPVGLPSELLERRPDVRIAERRLAAANAEVGVQEAAQFPKVNLIGLASFASTSASDLFSAPNFSSGALGMVSQPIFNGGRIRASIASAKEARTQAAIAYRSAALGAFRDVEDALARYQAEDARRASLIQAVAAADKSLGIAKDQYRVGLSTFTTVLQAQSALLNSQDQLTQSDAQMLGDLVSIYKALGGGWSA